MPSNEYICDAWNWQQEGRSIEYTGVIVRIQVTSWVISLFANISLKRGT